MMVASPWRGVLIGPPAMMAAYVVCSKVAFIWGASGSISQRR
jgi:hypothetical protein